MSRTNYNVKQSYTGTGSLSAYTFPFKIEAKEQLEIVVLNSLGVEIQRVRGDDLTFLSSVVFNPVTGGGTVNLIANLPAANTLLILLANDAPTQPYEFSDKTSFSLKKIERALDFIAGAVQRLTYKTKQSLRIHDADDEETFNGQLPAGIGLAVGKAIIVNSTGTGLEFGPDLSSPTAGSGVPVGGGVGAALVKNSATDGDAIWDDLVISGFSSRLGVAWSSVGLRDFIEQFLAITYLGPLIASFSGSSNVLREKGTVVSGITLSVNVTKRSNPIGEIKFLQGATVIQDMLPPVQTGSGVTNQVYAPSFSDNITFTVQVTDALVGVDGLNTVSANTSYSFVYPYYNGAGAQGKTPAQVAALTKSVINSTATLNKVFTTSNGNVYYFAYPASYGNLISILDENGFETFSSWTKTVSNITGLDGNAVSYNIYESNNPVVAGTTNFTFKR